MGMPSVQFKFYPPRGIDLPDFRPKVLRRDLYSRMYADFKRQMLEAATKKEGERTFQMVAESDISDKPVAWQFNWRSDTSALVIWARPTSGGQPPDLQAVSAFLTRLDPAAEMAMLDRIKANPNMRAVDPAFYEDAKNIPCPLVATFFVNEQAVTDSLIRAIATMTAAAFFDQFGMADPNDVINIRFQAMVFAPDAGEPLRIREVVIPQAEQQELFEDFNKAIKEGPGFRRDVSFAGDPRPVTIMFEHVGQTAAFFVLTHDGEPKHIHGVVALLTKFDAAEDRNVMDIVRKYAALRGLNPSSFDEPLGVNYPIAAAFFADRGSANYPPLHNIIKILGAAYFGQFGIGHS